MTNKVKPFYIRITDDMTPQMVQDAFDKCVDVGAYAGDCLANASSRHEYESKYEIGEFNFFGVNGGKVYHSVRLYNHTSDFEGGAQEITLDQLDEWLGIAGDSPRQEWNGEGLPPVGFECEIYTYDSPVDLDSMSWHKAKVLSIHDAGFGAENIVTYTCDWNPNFYVDAHPAGRIKFRKPETPEQKAERERLEAAYDLYCNAQHAVDIICYDSFGVFKSDKVQVKFWLSIVDKTGYRKQ